ncbi:MAG: hypothetical protein ABIE74_08370 [Pseudomonadota bacterium]
MKKKIPLLIAFITGTIFILARFIPREPFGSLREDFSVWFNVLQAFAFILGGGNLLLYHISKTYKKHEGWGYSLVAIISFLLMMAAGMFKIGNPGGWAGEISDPNALAGYIFDYVYTPLASTMFSLLAFFVASASYRAFRAKNREATILLVSAFIILLGRTFVGTALTSWLPESLSFLQIPELFNWILSFPNTAGQRAIMIGIALGVVSTSLKLILGIESAYLGTDEKK